jgi:hypothetical protein
MIKEAFLTVEVKSALTGKTFFVHILYYTTYFPENKPQKFYESSIRVPIFSQQRGGKVPQSYKNLANRLKMRYFAIPA